MRAFVAPLSSSSPKLLSSLLVSSHHQCDASYSVCVSLCVLCVCTYEAAALQSLFSWLVSVGSPCWFVFDSSLSCFVVSDGIRLRFVLRLLYIHNTLEFHYSKWWLRFPPRPVAHLACCYQIHHIRRRRMFSFLCVVSFLSLFFCFLSFSRSMITSPSFISSQACIPSSAMDAWSR